MDLWHFGQIEGFEAFIAQAHRTFSATVLECVFLEMGTVNT
jgi:hypothetical protein